MGVNWAPLKIWTLEIPNTHEAWFCDLMWCDQLWFKLRPNTDLLFEFAWQSTRKVHKNLWVYKLQLKRYIRHCGGALVSQAGGHRYKPQFGQKFESFSAFSLPDEYLVRVWLFFSCAVHCSWLCCRRWEMPWTKFMAPLVWWADNINTWKLIRVSLSFFVQ